MNLDIRKQIKILFIFIIALLTDMSTQAQPKQTIKEKVTQINRQLFDALIDGNANKVTALYTTDGTLFPPSGKTIKGQNAIHNYWAGSIESSKTLKVETQNIDFELYRDDTAYESGNYQLDYRLPNESEIRTAKGVYLIIWKRVGDTWKLHVDLWN